MAKFLVCLITFQKTDKDQPPPTPRRFKTSSRTDVLKSAAEALGLPGSSEKHFASRNVLHIYCEGHRVLFTKTHEEAPHVLHRQRERKKWEGHRPIAWLLGEATDGDLVPA